MEILNWGLVPYTEAVDKQLALVDNVRQGGEDKIVVCTHPPIVTAGRGTRDSDIFSWPGEVAETSRGGRATYHGPSQIIVYPIVTLAVNRDRVPAKDLHAYLRALETAAVETLDRFGISGESRQVTDDSGNSFTGVWVGDKKIASIGIAARSWVTYHGIALNVENDPMAFQGINPCGFSSNVMTSMEQEIGRRPPRDEVTTELCRQIQDKLVKI